RAVVGAAGSGRAPRGARGRRRRGRRPRPEAEGGARRAPARAARGVPAEARRTAPLRRDGGDHRSGRERAQDASEASFRSGAGHVDGERSMSDLDPRLEPWLSALRREPAARPEARARLTAALRAEDVRAARRILSPPAALAAAIALVALTSAFWLALWRASTPQRAMAAEDLAPAQFVLHARDARS